MTRRRTYRWRKVFGMTRKAPGFYAPLFRETRDFDPDTRRRRTYTTYSRREVWAHLMLDAECEEARLRRLEQAAAETAEWRASVVSAYSVKPRGCPVSVQRYEVRVHKEDLPYARSYACGYAPIEVAHILSGSGVPRWMTRLCEALDQAMIEEGECTEARAREIADNVYTEQKAA